MDHNYKQIDQTNNIESHECVAKGICSNVPALSFMHEVIIAYLQDLAFYLTRLKKLGITNEQIKETVIDIISSIIVNTYYGESIFNKIIVRIYADLTQAKELYSSICKKNNLKEEFLKTYLKNPQKLPFHQAIRLGQNIFNKKFKNTSIEQKNLSELILNVVKSIGVHLIELKELNIDIEEGYELILSLLDTRNLYTITEEELREILDKIVKFDHSLLEKLHNTREEKYGLIVPTEVSASTRPNKAILVSGTNLRELELLLEATKDKGIDIYTHGNMLMAHAFPKFKAYSHLAGHWGQDLDTYLFDFAEFPGVILMTKHSFYKIENLYRSRVFSTDVIAPKGVALIRDNNFGPLIESAHEAKGFSKGIEKTPIKINLNEQTAIEKINDIAQKIERGEIKYFFNIGVSNHTKKQKDYFERFLSLLKNDCFVLSFSYTNNKNNVLLIESEYGFPLFYKLFDALIQKIPTIKSNTIMCVTRCQVNTISNALYMKSLGINKIYFPDCPPNLINPYLVNAMKEMFNFKSYTSPDTDLKNMLNEK